MKKSQRTDTTEHLDLHPIGGRAAHIETAALRDWYRLMHMGRLLDEKASRYLKMSRGWSYHAPCAGHEGIQLALGLHVRRGSDFLFPYYRDLVTVLGAGMTPEEIILNGLSKATDPASGGRHMSNHFAKPEMRIENVSSCVASHSLHAVGVDPVGNRYAFVAERDDTSRGLYVGVVGVAGTVGLAGTARCVGRGRRDDVRLFVTGGGGLLGRHLRHHVAGEHEVVAPTSAELDVRDGTAFEEVVRGVAAEHGRLDFLFNNAGIVIVGGAELQALAGAARRDGVQSDGFGSLADKLRDALSSTNMSTFYGGIRFSEAGNNIAKPMVLRQIQNGKLNVVAPSKWASHPVEFPRVVN